MPNRRPNIVVFFTDQQRWDSSGLHGNPLDLTPNFDRMAIRGTHAVHAFTPQPVCGPARACLQTGLYATANGCYRNGIPMKPDATTMARCLKAGGYATGYIGKWHLANVNEKPVPAELRGGYDYWLASDALEFTSDAYDCRMFDSGNNSVKLPGYRVDALTDAAIRYIDDRSKLENREQPFFLFTSFIEPHFQNHRDDHPAPSGYAERYHGRWTPPDLAAIVSARTGYVGGNAQAGLGGYWGMIKRLDEALGRLLDALESLDQLKNTVVVFTSDHGCHFKTRNNEYKRSCHDASIRVPMALRGGPFTGGGSLQQMISLVDLPPTLLDVAGVPIPAAWQGRSILPLVNREKVDWPAEAFVQISESQVGRAVRTKRWKYSVSAPHKNAVTDMGSDVYREEFLYDLYADPYELNNLIGLASHRAVADRMRDRLLARMAQAGEPPATVQPAESRPGGQKHVSAAEVEL